MNPYDDFDLYDLAAVAACRAIEDLKRELREGAVKALGMATHDDWQDVRGRIAGLSRRLYAIECRLKALEEGRDAEGGEANG